MYHLNRTWLSDQVSYNYNIVTGILPCNIALYETPYDLDMPICVGISHTLVYYIHDLCKV